MLQKNSYVPVSANVKLKVLPASTLWLNFPLGVPGTPLVTVCVVPSSFVHVIVAPFVALSCTGLNAKPLMDMAPLLDAPVFAGVDQGRRGGASHREDGEQECGTEQADRRTHQLFPPFG